MFVGGRVISSTQGASFFRHHSGGLGDPWVKLGRVACGRFKPHSNPIPVAIASGFELGPGPVGFSRMRSFRTKFSGTVENTFHGEPFDLFQPLSFSSNQPVVCTSWFSSCFVVVFWKAPQHQCRSTLSSLAERIGSLEKHCGSPSKGRQVDA